MGYKREKSVWIEDIKRAILNPGFVMGVLGLTVMLMRTVWTFALTPGTVTVMEICSYPMALSGFTIFSAAFPSWGYAGRFYQEEKTHYSYFISSRMSWKSYAAMKMLSVGILGGLIIAVPLALLFVYAYLIGNKEVGELFWGMHVRDTIINLGIPVVLLIKICLGGLFGIFWAWTGLLSSMLVRNKYAPYLIPLILNQFFWMMFADHQWMNPVYLVRGEDLDSYGLSALFLFFYCFVVAFFLLWFFRRRLIR